uniref:NADH-ubiquinone oxidoreductase chain 5 n=1 Tax=Mukaria splendida TaxID=2586309 RepID=A0A7L8ZUL2_9HEMI|nr:NADH dehydrogenase subunit 5 [Mukaria splendida]QOI73922.1 NADH dehydrogenase subunit 5 [Mukaria splendida]
MFKLNLYYIWSFFLFFLSFMFLMLFFVYNNSSLMFEWVFYSYTSISFVYIIYVDNISMIFSFVVFFISSMVILYSSVYMGDYNYSSIRFLFLVLIFVFSMLLMILSPNLISIMLGWDGLGLVSYCLVIYYNSLSSYLAGLITCLINRLGDIGLLLCISWLMSYGSWNFMFYLNFYSNYFFYLLILSSFTKSAQIPFSVWLPAAMAAPTPVSSLVHSSTLVTAGVYLLIRFFNSLIMVNEFFFFMSVLTLIMASMCANYEFDLKSIIAFSTLSQLGLMMSCLFLGLKDSGFFHLLTHAMFKSLLFLCSGVIIHLIGYQDIRMMGSIVMTMPLTCCCFNISNMALCGIPFLSSFYSKDMIIETMSFLGYNLFMLMLMYMGLGLTCSYSIRLLYYSLIKNFNFLGFMNLIESISLMEYSILFLSFFSITFGSMYMWLTNLDLKFLILPFYLKLLSFAMISLGLFIGYELLNYENLMKKSFYFLNGSMWFIYSYSYNLIYMNFMFSLNLNQMMFWGEFYGGMGLMYYITKISNFIQLYYMNPFKIFFIMIILWMLFII